MYTCILKSNFMGQEKDEVDALCGLKKSKLVPIQ
jgi:hypothetical protein